MARQSSPRTPAGRNKAGIRVRMYRVGFGDFFLLTFTSAGKSAHVLVDCGVHAKPTNSIGQAIEQLAAETGNHLELIIVTHRHADHISGFALGAEKFANFTVDQIWMPWFENPKDPTAVALQANLVRMALGLQIAFAARKADNQYLTMAENATGPLDAAGTSLNAKALSVLHGGFANSPAIDYLKAGDVPQLPPALAAMGVTARILGPPIDPRLIGQMDSKSHQYLDQLEADEGRSNKTPIFAEVFAADEIDYTSDQLDAAELGEIEKRIAESQPDVIQAIAVKADNTLNNQSVVALLEFAGKKLLLAGDAQWGNWQNFLFGGALGTPGHETLSKKAKAILGSIDFYKVGHHGSTNATPIDALEAMRDGLVAMCSTAENAYNEVPRGPLLDALNKKAGGKVARSDQVAVSGAPPIDLPLDSVFTTPTDELFIDYHL